MFEAQVTQKQKESCQTWTTTMQRVPDIMLQSRMAATPVVLETTNRFSVERKFPLSKDPNIQFKIILSCKCHKTLML